MARKVRVNVPLDALGPGGPPEGLAEGAVNGVHDVSVDHRHFIDDESVDGVQDLALIGTMVQIQRTNQAGGQTEQRVNRLAANIQCGHTRWGTHRNGLLGSEGQVVQQGRFTSTRTTCDEHMLSSFLNEVKDLLLLRR